MVKFTTTIQQFAKQGEKTGWTYVSIPADIATAIHSGDKKGFRVKGKLDDFAISGIAVLPMGNGSFILPLNAALRKGIGKRKGAMLTLQLTEDKKGYELNKEFMECLEDDPDALTFFKTQTRSMQNYFSKWIETAKTDATKTKRIAMAVSALSQKLNYSEMIRKQKKDKEDLLG
ncbi:YdeI/OmpD-associated family protein [Ferruginibacter lapsinanis]|uniref:YdeI/OmpD-associated family protein n=1 Tax=Ferruginibacter lapsinanis TaxID=563172 RepID=UPI001E535121|nr:YdeI/OmpD-associated family protein [Ferruginibacter lapsinanis]UEG49941.1 YdeI/OmpD-associated family protein [Ferruginibacter lapsinanis]